MKKRNKNILKLVCLTLVITTIIPSINGEDTVLTTLEYKDSDTIFIPGNITLSFNNSDTGKEDVSILWRVYNSDNNITIFYIISTTINYDSSFVNNTKSYYYTRKNISNETYIINVDYSSINVPTSIEDILNETIQQQNQTIKTQEEIIDELKQNVSSLKEKYNQSILKEYELEEQIEELKGERDNAIAENIPLQNEISNLEEQLSFQQNKSKELNDQINYKESFINNLEETVNQLSNPWCTGYSYHGKNQGFYFNYSSIIIGIMIGLALIVLIEKILEYKGIKIKWNKKKAFGSFHKKDKLDGFSADVEEDLPFSEPEGLKKLREAEKEIIKPDEKTSEEETKDEKEEPEDKKPSEEKKESLDYLDIEKEVDNIISNHQKNEVEYIR